MLPQTLHICVGSDSQTIQIFDLPKILYTVKPMLAVTSIKQQPVLSSQTKCSQMLNLY